MKVMALAFAALTHALLSRCRARRTRSDVCLRRMSQKARRFKTEVMAPGGTCLAGPSHGESRGPHRVLGGAEQARARRVLPRRSASQPLAAALRVAIRYRR